MYFVPVSSPKDKHLKMKNPVDFMKLDKGALGAINFNDMIPVKKAFIKILFLNKFQMLNIGLF